ncbi:hypothetical protein QEN19_004373 [Hanseniaspora menglaensis]
MTENKDIENKLLSNIQNEESNSSFNRGSFASLSSSFGNLMTAEKQSDAGLANSNAHSTVSFKTLTSRLKLEKAVSTSPNESRSNSNLNLTNNFYQDSESDSKNTSREQTPDVDSTDSMDMFRDTRRGFFEALFDTRLEVDSSKEDEFQESGDDTGDSYSKSSTFDSSKKHNSSTASSTKSIFQKEWFNFTSSIDTNQLTGPTDLSFMQKQMYLVKQNWKKMFKFTLAYFLALLLCVIPACRRWFGSNLFGQHLVWFLPLAVIVYHPCHYSSVQIEMTVQAIIGGLFAIAWSMLALFVATCDLRLINDTFGVGALLWLSLFISTLFSYWLSNRFRKLLYISETFTIATIYFHLINVKSQLFNVSSNVVLTSAMNKNWGKVIWPFAVPYAFGLLISLVVSIAIYPDYDNTSLIKSYNRMIEQMATFLDEILVKGNDLKEIKEKLIHVNNFDFLKQYADHRFVFKYTSFTNIQMKTLRDDLIGLMTILRAMSTDGAAGCFDHEGTVKSTFETSLREIIAKMSELMKMNFEILSEKKKVSLEFLYQHESSTEYLTTITKNLDTLYDCYQLPDNEKDLSMLTINSLLFIKSIKATAKNVTTLALDLNEISKNSQKSLQYPNVSLFASLSTLSAQGKLDQGFGDECDTIQVSDEASTLLTEIYNTYTSKYSSKSSSNDGLGFKIRSTMAKTLPRNKFIDDQGFIRAINTKDYMSKTTVSDFRYKLWLIKKSIINDSLWYAFEVAFVFSFILLPGWIPSAHKWFSKYQIWAGCILFHTVNNKNNIGGFETISLRLVTCLVSCFFGWVAIMMKPFSSPYIIMFIGGIVALVSSHFYFNHHFTKNGAIALISFTIVVAQPWGQVLETTADVWKHTWTTSLSLLVGTLISVLINWVLASKSTHVRISDSLSSLISHLGHDYQLVVDRFLYKDCRDATTILDSEYSNVLEIKLTREIIKIENLINRSFIEHKPFFHKPIDRVGYLKLVETCKEMLENLIQARQEAQFFDVFNGDLSDDMTILLMSFRSASVSSCCYNFTALANCFQSDSPLPDYLPNTTLARKQLYDKLAMCQKNTNKEIVDEKRDNISNDELIHSMSFANAFTNISINLESLVSQSKALLAEHNHA